MINVFNIERFATHDGPGIRTVIFLKGCPLHCPWCSNPESWNQSEKLLYDRLKCVKCETCALRCPSKAITFNNHMFCYDVNKCIHCHKCEDNCLEEAITFVGKQMEIDEILNQVMKDKDYYVNSSGGVTISGGEPFVQYESFCDLVKACKRKNLHVAVETTGQCALEKIKQIEPMINLFLYDLKHIDESKLKEVTGGDLKIISNNLAYLLKTVPEKVIVRVPVIPEFNYEKETLRQLMKLVQSLGGREVHLLPYHTLGKNKYEKMLNKYPLGDIRMLTKSDLSPYGEIGKSYGLKVKIGG